MNATKISIYQQTDILLSNLFTSWPFFFRQKNSTIYRSANFFNAILLRHRSSVKGGLYFWDEIQFYADIIENVLLWLDYEIDECLRSFQDTSNHYLLFLSPLSLSSMMNKALKSFNYLVNSLAYLGAEQSLCICFHSLICFSHKETFYYANLTFSAEMMFRTYIHSLKLFTEHKNDDIKTREYNVVFPELSYCRQEILSGMDNVGVAIGPSVCNQSRRNETSILDVNNLANKELVFFEDLLYNILSNRIENTKFFFVISTIVFTFCSVYVVLTNLFRLIYYKSKKPKNKRKKKQLRFDASSHDSLQNETICRSVQLTNLPHLPQLLPPLSTKVDSNGPTNFYLQHQQHHQHQQNQHQQQQHLELQPFTQLPGTSHCNSLASNHIPSDSNVVNFAALKVASV